MLRAVHRFDGDLLRRARRTTGQSLTDLAIDAGVSALDLHRWERSADVPTVPEFDRLCAVLGIDEDDIGSFRVVVGWQQN